MKHYLSLKPHSSNHPLSRESFRLEQSFIKLLRTYCQLYLKAEATRFKETIANNDVPPPFPDYLYSHLCEFSCQY